MLELGLPMSKPRKALHKIHLKIEKMPKASLKNKTLLENNKIRNKDSIRSKHS